MYCNKLVCILHVHVGLKTQNSFPIYIRTNNLNSFKQNLILDLIEKYNSCAL